jgi:hypothetical protein
MGLFFGTLDATKTAMTNRPVAIIVALALAACRRQDRAQRSQPNYEVVQEGSASGVTSTINGPGETTPPTTDTNVDTTTNFTLPNNPNPLGNETDGSTVAGSPPSNPIDPAGTPGMTPAPRRTRANDTRGMASASAPIMTDTMGSTTPPMAKEMHAAPPASDTSMTTSTSDTASTTTTSSPSDTKKKKDDSSKSGDQQQPPPPPPTDATGTRG